MYHIYIMYYWYLWETHASTLRNKLYMNDHWPAYNHSTEYRGPSRVDDIIGIVVFDRYIDPQWGQHQKHSDDGGGEPHLCAYGLVQKHGHPCQKR